MVVTNLITYSFIVDSKGWLPASFPHTDRTRTPLHNPLLAKNHVPRLASLTSSKYLLLGVFTSKHPRSIGVHQEVPARWGAPVQSGPGEECPGHRVECVVWGVVDWRRGLMLDVSIVCR